MRGVLCLCNRLNTSSTTKGGIQVGYKIKELREALKMTQEELAEKSGVSRGTISALENGVDRTTTSKTLVKLAQALNTSVDRIFFTEGV